MKAWIICGLAAIGIALSVLVLGPSTTMQPKEDKAMTAQLKYVKDFTVDEQGESAVVTFEDGQSVTLVNGQDGVDLQRKRAWLEADLARGAPVAYFPEESGVMPATVTFGVEIRDAGPDRAGAMAVFGFPRPSLMYLMPEVEGRDRLAKLIEQAAEEGSAAVFAIRGAFEIEDVLLISREAAGAMKGVEAR